MPHQSFEDLAPGNRLIHTPRRTVTETDNLRLTTLTHTPQPLHLVTDYARNSEFGQIVVNGLFTFALMIGLSVSDTTRGTIIANLGHHDVKMPKPIFIGATPQAETIIAEQRAASSRPTAGIVVFGHLMRNQRGDIVCTAKRTALIHRKPS